MRHLLQTAAVGAIAIVALATPAFAELVVYVEVSGHVDTFSTSADSLLIPTFTLDGVTVAGEEALAIQGSSGSADILGDSVLSVTNTTGAAKSIEIVVSDTGFNGPVNAYAAAGSGTWQNNVSTPPNTITMNWYADSADGQGGIGGATPGTDVNTFTNSATSALQGFSTSASGAFDAAGPVSMTMSASYTLKGKGVLLNRGFDESLSVVPEPSTWAMMLLGFAGLGYAAFRRAAKGRALAV
jgi:PEP-CTERM motif